MASEHPFQLLFETLGRVPAAHAESVNRQAYEILSDILSAPVEKPGRCIMLRAPRAGHGKTHLLSRIQHQLGASHEFIPLHAAFGCRIDAVSVTDDTLRRLVRQLPAAGGLTVLDLVTRRLFSSALQPLVASGEVPCQDREGALTALRARPIETFDFHHPNAVTAHWARENFEVLGQRLSLELAQRADLPVSDVAYWVDALFRFASSPLENTSRVRTLVDGVHGAVGEEMERLESLLGLLTLLMRVVLVADDLEGFSTDESAALKLAAFLGSLRQSVERLDVILSLNQDIWQSAFVPRLSDGLADRLSEVVVELEPLTEAEMVALLDSRVPGLGSRVLQRIDVKSAGTHARGLIRAAGLAWLKATAMDTAPTTVMEPAPEDVPVVETPLPVAPPPATESVVEPEPPPISPAAPDDESPAFSFSSNAPPAPVEEPVVWPSPEFIPAPMVEIETEEVTSQSPVDSSFWIEHPDLASEAPVASFTPTEWQGYEPEKVPASRPSQAEPPPYYPPEESPVSIPDEPQTAFAPGEWQGTPPPPDSDPPGIFASSRRASPEPSAYHPPVDPAEPPAPIITHSEWPESAPLAAPQAPDNSAPAQPAMDSPFQVTPEPAFPPPPNPEPVFNPPPPAPDAPPPARTADTDRVDDLLRQFRERYGRGSL